MSDVRELLARLNPTTIRMDIGTGGGVDTLTNIDIAGALGMVPAGLGRDLFELLYGPDPSRREIIRVMEGIARLALEERNKRFKAYADARATWGIAACIARFNRNGQEGARRNLDVLKARVAVAREQLMPERLDERLPAIVAVVIGYMKGERLSNRERAGAIQVSDSTYRESWAATVDWLITQLTEAEARAVEHFEDALRSERSPCLANSRSARMCGSGNR